MKKSDELEIDFNTKFQCDNELESTYFFWACYFGQRYYSSSYKEHSEIAAMLLQKSTELKIDLNAKGYDRKTGFDWACNNGNLKLVEMIIQKSAVAKIDLNNRDNDGKTAFHHACANNHLEIVEILIQKYKESNFDLNGKDAKGWTAFHFACIWGHTEIGKYFFL